MTSMIRLNELRDRIDGMYAPVNSEEGQKVIHEGRDDQDGRPTHVTEVWEDGETTFTKCGDLYGRRRTHPKDDPLLPVGYTIFDPEEDFEDWDEYHNIVKSAENHKKMIVTDGRLLDILDEYRGVIIDAEAIEILKEHGKWEEPRI